MYTQTHLFIGAAAFARPGRQWLTAAAIAGALLPDLDVLTMFVVERIADTPGCEIFHYRYREEPWTTVQALINAIPLYALLTVIAVTARALTSGYLRTLMTAAAVFGASALLHVSADFLLHHDDARRQLLPLSDFVFRSPVSYWDPEHFGRWFVLAEVGLAAKLAYILGRRFRRKGVWITLAVTLALYLVAIPASFMELVTHDKGPGSCEALEASQGPGS